MIINKTFDLSDPDDMYIYECQTAGATLWELLFDFDQELRSRIKHGKPDDSTEGLTVARDLLWEFANASRIDLGGETP